MWRTRIFLLLIFSFASAEALAQHPLLESMTLRQVGNTVRVDFGIKGGVSCFGVQLERRTANDDFVEISSIPGICGGSEFTEFYALNDPFPVANAEASYRLVLGQQGTTEELSIIFIPIPGDIIVYPNPVLSIVSIRWIAEDGRLYNLCIHDTSGRQVYAAQVTAPQTSILVSHLPQGLYILHLEALEGARSYYTLLKKV